MSKTLWLPGVTREPITPGSNDPTIKPVVFSIHRSASRQKDLHDYFDGPSGGIESHGYTRRDGRSFQYRDLFHEADAQSAGNSWLSAGVRLGTISWETEGLGSDEWTPVQIAELTRVLREVVKATGIPLRIVTDPNPPSLAKGGVGWHSKFKSWNPNVHDCPGARNVAHIPAIIRNARPATSAPAPAPAPAAALLPEEDDMPYQLYQTGPGAAIYAVTLNGAAHIKNLTHLAILRAEGRVSADVKAITKKQLADLLEIEK